MIQRPNCRYSDIRFTLNSVAAVVGGLAGAAQYRIPVVRTGSLVVVMAAVSYLGMCFIHRVGRLEGSGPEGQPACDARFMCRDLARIHGSNSL